VIAFVVGSSAFALDQLAKAIAFRFYLPVLNTKSRYLTRQGLNGSLAVWSVLALVIVVLFGRPPLAGESLALAGLGAALGGAAGNVFDELRRGGVVDFISIGRWPTFNLADAAIVAGVLLTLGALV